MVGERQAAAAAAPPPPLQGCRSGSRTPGHLYLSTSILGKPWLRADGAGDAPPSRGPPCGP